MVRKSVLTYPLICLLETFKGPSRESSFATERLQIGSKERNEQTSYKISEEKPTRPKKPSEGYQLSRKKRKNRQLTWPMAFLHFWFPRVTKRVKNMFPIFFDKFLIKRMETPRR